MDIQKHLISKVSSAKERDAAAALLRERYAKAVEGTEWETLIKQLARRERITEPSWYQLFEVEGRGVGVVWPSKGLGSAWVWDGSWRFAPALVNKSWVEGHQLDLNEFRSEYPSADLLELERLLSDALIRAGDPTPAQAPVESSFDADLMANVMREAAELFESGLVQFPELASAVISRLGLPARPYLRGCYSALRYSPGNDECAAMTSENEVVDFLARWDDDEGDEETNDPEPEKLFPIERWAFTALVQALDALIVAESDRGRRDELAQARKIIERLPYWQSGDEVELTAYVPGEGASLSLSASELELSFNGHEHTPGVGGDSWSDVLFACDTWGGYRGDLDSIEQWSARFAQLSKANLSCNVWRA